MKLKVQDLNNLPNFVILHGWGVNSGVFKHLLEHLPDYLRVRLIDLPGFGSNNHLDIADIEFDVLCDCIAAALPERSILMGWSLGGLIAQQIALNHPKKLAAVIQVCSSPKFVADENWHGIKPQVLDQFSQQLSDDIAQTIDRFLAIQAMGSKTARQDIKSLREMVLNSGLPNLGALIKGLTFLHSVDLREHIIQCHVATLRIFGAKDSLVPLKCLEALEELCPNSHKAVLSAASHAPFISHPKEFTAELDKYLSQSGVDIP